MIADRSGKDRGMAGKRYGWARTYDRWSLTPPGWDDVVTSGPAEKPWRYCPGTRSQSVSVIS